MAKIKKVGIRIDVTDPAEAPNTVYFTFRKLEQKCEVITVNTYVKVDNLPEELKQQLRDHLGIKVRGPGWTGGF